MCGRYTLAVSYEDLAEELGVAIDPQIRDAYRPRYNVAPTDGNVVLTMDEGERVIVPARFGLVNFWAKDLSGAARQINARSETVQEKPAFREAFAKRRCVVPADGFYEWRAEGRKKTPLWFHPAEGKILRLAGIFETWKDKVTGDRLRTFAILTTSANDVVAFAHDRMPVILAPTDVDTWLTATPDQVRSLMRPAANDVLAVQRASSRVGNVRNDDPGLLAEEPAPEASLPLFDRREAKG